MGYRQREADRDRGIHRVSARLHHFDPGIGRVALHRGHHGLGRVRRLHHVPASAGAQSAKISANFRKCRVVFILNAQQENAGA